MSDPALAWLRSEGSADARPFADRAAMLTRSDRAHYRRVLEQFIEGRPYPSRALPDDVLARLTARDLIQPSSDRTVAVAYPFSAERTRHRVALLGGRSYWAMCAVDALAIPYMLRESGEVEAWEPGTGRVVRVTVDPDGEPDPTPSQAVALDAFGDGRCLARAACPHVNLFASPDAATRYLSVHALEGHIISVADAAEAGRWLFGDLLERLVDSEES